MRVLLVAVQVAGKYLTGEPATWGEGDWNGTPLMFSTDPPEGDGLFNQLDVVAALAPGHWLAGQGQAATFPATSPGGLSSPALEPGFDDITLCATSSRDAMAEQTQIEFAPVPEPSTAALAILAALVAGVAGAVTPPIGMLQQTTGRPSRANTIAQRFRPRWR